MDGLTWSDDERNAMPTPLHLRSFKTGWKDALAGHVYEAGTLERLTWQNLGNRLGRLLGPASEEALDGIFEALARQRREGMSKPR